MTIAFPLTVHIAPLIGLVLVWAVALQVTAATLAWLSGRSLIAWSIGILGIAPIVARKPPGIVRIAGMLLPVAVAALAGYEALRLAIGAPVSDLPNTMAAQAWVALGGAVALSLPRLAGALHEARFPLWGEARVLDRVARHVALGNIIHFTVAGRAYIRDRFGMNTEEFVRIARRRPSSLATGTPL